MGDLRFDLFHPCHIVMEQRFVDFDIHFHIIQTMRTGQNNLIDRENGFGFHNRSFDLRREHVHAADDEHVVGTTAGLGHLDECTPAGALLAGDDADVAGAVAQEREGFAGEAGEDNLATATPNAYLIISGPLLRRKRLFLGKEE